MSGCNECENREAEIGRLNRTIDIINEKKEWLHSQNCSLLDECVRLNSPLFTKARSDFQGGS